MKLHDAWVELLGQLLETGKDAAPRGKRTKEILGHRIVVDDWSANLLDVPARKLNFRFAVAEAAWIAFGRDDTAPLVRYNPNMLAFSDDGATLDGAYGPRILPQVRYVVESLRKDPFSRQAVLTIWTPNPGPSKDVPCTVSMQFLLREGRLHAVVTMRSNDAWLGTPYDMFSFGFIAAGIAAEVGAAPGSMTLQMGSSHLYEEHWQAAADILSAPSWFNHGTIAMPTFPCYPRGFSSAHLLGDLPAQDPSSYAGPLETLLEHDPGVEDEEFQAALATALHPAWRPYARALLSSKSSVAREILRGER